MNVLLLAYFFPPLGGAGVQRAVKVARYLAELGHRVTVVTGPGGAKDRWAPRDETLADELAVVDVHRAAGPEPARSVGRQARAERWLRRPSPWSTWWVSGARTAAVAAGRRTQPDVVLATMSPFESAEVAAAVAKDLSIPWVADLRDPWALDEMQVYPSRMHRTLERRRMRRALASATAIVMNTTEASMRLVAAFPELRTKRLATISNGFDPEDFRVEPELRDDDAFRIVHAGYLHTELGAPNLLRRLLGGRDSGVDIMARSHVNLVRAVQLVSEREPKLAKDIELHLAGVLSEGDRRAASAPFIRERGYLAHRDNVALLLSADLLFLPMHGLPTGRRATIVPGKTYEYVASGRPILAAVPEGDGRELLESVRMATICAPSRVECLASGIVEAVRRKGDDATPPHVPAAFAATYEWRALVGRLAEVLENVMDHPVAQRPQRAAV